MVTSIFYRREHKYHLEKDGVEFIVRVHQNKNHLNSVNVNQMKRLISSNKRFVIMCVKDQHNNEHDSCLSYATQLKYGLIKEIETCSVLCKTKHFIHKQGLQHEL